MKKLFYFLILILLFLPTNFAKAQSVTPQQCATINTPSLYQSCCAIRINKPAACFSLSVQDKCSIGLLSGTDCQPSSNNQLTSGLCTDITSKDDFNNCCVNPPSSSINDLNVNLCDAYYYNGPTSQEYMCAAIEAKGGANTSNWINSGCQILSMQKAGTWQSTCSTLSPTDPRYSQLSCAGASVDPATIKLLCSKLDPKANADAWLKAGCDGYAIPNNGASGYGAGFTAPIIGTDPNTLLNSYLPARVITSCTGINYNNPDFSSITNVLVFAKCFIGSILPIFLTLAFLFFLWNIAQYVIRPNPLKNEERRNYIIWGFIALFVMVTLWGLVYFATGTLGIGSVVPQIPVTKIK